MRSTGMTLTPVERCVVSGDRRLTMAGESSRSSDSRRAAAARKSGLAKLNDLPGELAVRLRRLRGSSIGGDRTSHERRLSQLDAGSDDGGEDVVVADDAK